MSFTLTADLVKKVCPKAKPAIVEGVVKYFNKWAPKYGVDTKLRVTHFLAQAAHECDSFKTLHEYWGPTAAQKRYEGREDLGNTQAGDGKRFMGRGIFQITGRANYARLGKKLNIDLLTDPTKAEDPEVSVLTALEYWSSNNLNKWADADDIRRITKRINGGYNGFEDRKAYYAKFKGPVEIAFNTPAPPPAADPPEVAQPAHPEDCDDCKVSEPVVDKPLSYEQAVQVRLNKKLGIELVVDGIHGTRTKNAIREFQKKQGIYNTGLLDTQTILELFTD